MQPDKKIKPEKVESCKRLEPPQEKMQPEKKIKPEKLESFKRLEPPQPYKFSERVRGTAVGIDIGTTYSRVAVWSDKHNRVEIIPNKHGNKSTPACVARDGTQFLVGEAAGKIPITTDSANSLFGMFIRLTTLHLVYTYPFSSC
ncbi:heat shock protein 70 family [Artemisia annua]|uniref:Heat shock protein 70 family n=1 Tax=Artemisia annua TaxID=35608 RepID=A0A2U1Q2U4_ARTAN|nr:heat shock protein 70 family [Artemisia annua]